MSIANTAPSMKSQKRIATRLNAMKEGGTAHMNTTSGPYPFTAFAKDSRDNRFSILRDQLNAGVAPRYQITEDDLDYIWTQKQQLEQLQFDKWIWNMYDLKDPAIRQWFIDHIDAGIYDRMLQYLNASLENTKRYSRINMMGPSSKEDLEFVYALQQGLIHIPASFDPGQMDRSLAGSTREGRPYNANLGVFNPLGIRTPIDAGDFGWSANQQNVFSRTWTQADENAPFVPTARRSEPGATDGLDRGIAATFGPPARG